MNANIRSELADDLPANKNRICWSAIFAGITIALVTTSLLNLLGIGLGLTLFTTETEVMAGIGIGAVIWLVFSSIISMATGGWVAGRFSSTYQSTEGLLHGLVTWGLATLLTFAFMATTAGALISGTLNVVGTTLSAAGTGVTKVAQLAPQAGKALQNIVPDLQPAIDKAKQQADEFIRNSPTSTEEVKNQLNQVVTSFLTATDQEDINEARNQLKMLLSQITGMNDAELNQTIDEWQQDFNEAKDTIMQKADEANQQLQAAAVKTAKTTGQFSLVSFFVLLIGAAAAGLGGRQGATRK